MEPTNVINIIMNEVKVTDTDFILPIPIIEHHATPSCLGDYFADIICSKFNQHVILRIVGIAGTGKSYAAIDLALEVAACVAERKGGTVEDYYSFEKDMGVMGQAEIKRVMTNPGKYHILHLDDVGVSWNARKAFDPTNIDLNDIIQTFRPNNNLVIMTMQSGFLIDKVPRALAHYEIEMESAVFSQGFTIAKVQEVVLKHKTGEIHYPYIFIDGKRYKRHIFEKPPEEWVKKYEAERAIQLKRLSEPKEDIEVTKAITKKGQLLFDVWVNLKNAGYSLREIGIMTHTDHSYISTALKKGGVVS